MTAKQQQRTNDKSERFVKLASNRTQKILDAMDVLGNCFNRGNYEYTDEQTEKIFGALEDKMQSLRNLTQPDAKPVENAFTL